MKIYTKTGDNGETGLLGGIRVSKDNLRIDAYGTVDELNSFIGLTLTEIIDENVKLVLNKLQNNLFKLGSDLAAPIELNKFSVSRISEAEISEVEEQIDFFDSQLDVIKNFILPAGAKSNALLHICRTICRRVERLVVALSKKEKINLNIIIFLNRISDLLFVLSRFENKIHNIPDIEWQK